MYFTYFTYFPGLLVLLLICYQSIDCIEISEIQLVSDTFKIQNPYVFIEKAETKWNTFMKKVFDKNQTICINTDYMLNATFMNSGLVFSNTTEVLKKFEIGLTTPWIIFENVNYYSEMTEPIYFYQDKKIWENYKIKNIPVRNLLGNFTNDIFYPNTYHSMNVFERRSDFHGVELKTMTQPDSFYIQFSSDHQVPERLSTEVSDTYEVTGLVYGYFQDYLEICAKRLNFTFRQFNRIDGQWFTLDENTGKIGGMAKNLHDKEADFINTDVSYTAFRFQVLDYLFPLHKQQIGFVIKGNLAPKVSLDTFLTPFSISLWILLCISTLTMTMFGYITIKFSKVKFSYFY